MQGLSVRLLPCCAVAGNHDLFEIPVLHPLLLVHLNITSTVHCTVYAAADTTIQQQNSIQGRWWARLCTLSQHSPFNIMILHRQQTTAPSPWPLPNLPVVSTDAYCTREITAKPGHTSCFSVDMAWLQHVLNACQLSVHRCNDILPLLE